MVDDVRSGPSYIPGVSEARSEAAIPLIADGRLVGVLNVESPKVAAFAADSVRLFEIIAYQAATVIQATRWFTETARLAARDPLTGLANRRRFSQELTIALRRGERYGEQFAMVIFDLDHFKSVNDQHGHEAGDRLLVAVARTLSDGLRDTDVVARLGGEFGAILIPTGAEPALEVANRLRQRVAGLRLPLEDESDEARLSATAGRWRLPSVRTDRQGGL